MNIIDIMDDPRFFKPLFRDEQSWRAWRVFLKALFGIPITDKSERKLFRKCTGLKKPKNGPSKETYVIAGRRSGKSFISSLIAVYLAAFKDWSPYLNPGEKGWIFIIATDKDQAKIIMNYISGILNSNAVFRRLIGRELQWEIELKNGIVIAVKTCNYRTIRGFTVLAAICEEIAFWRDENSANPAQEVLAALRPALATIPESMLIGISTPYSRSGVLWEQFRNNFGKGDARSPLIWKAPTRVMNPTIDGEIIENDLREDYARAKSEWDAEWREDIEGFLSLEVIEAAVVPGRFELSRLKDTEYFGFIDASAGRQDSFTLAICHKEKSGNIVLDLIREVQPPFPPQSVVAEFSEELQDYGVSYIEGDRFSGEWVVSEFAKHGISMKNSELTTSEIYLEFLPLIMNNSVELLENRRLIDQLRGLERRTRPGGRSLISHAAFSGAHDDLAVAAAGACVLASKSDTDFFLLQEYALARANDPPGNISMEEDLECRSRTWLLTGTLPPPIDERVGRRQNLHQEAETLTGKNAAPVDHEELETTKSALITRWNTGTEATSETKQPGFGTKKTVACIKTVK